MGLPKNRYFMWPYVRIGHRVELENIHSSGTVVLESLASSPLLFYIHNLFTDSEADYLIDNALSLQGGNGLLRSTTGTKPREDRDLTKEVDSHRTSTNAWDMHSSVSRSIMERIFKILRIPHNMKQAGGLQIVRYQLTEAYREHHDYFPIGSKPISHNFDPYRWCKSLCYHLSLFKRCGRGRTDSI